MRYPRWAGMGWGRQVVAPTLVESGLFVGGFTVGASLLLSWAFGLPLALSPPAVELLPQRLVTEGLLTLFLLLWQLGHAWEPDDREQLFEWQRVFHSDLLLITGLTLAAFPLATILFPTSHVLIRLVLAVLGPHLFLNTWRWWEWRRQALDLTRQIAQLFEKGERAAGSAAQIAQYLSGLPHGVPYAVRQVRPGWWELRIDEVAERFEEPLRDADRGLYHQAQGRRVMGPGANVAALLTVLDEPWRGGAASSAHPTTLAVQFAGQRVLLIGPGPTLGELRGLRDALPSLASIDVVELSHRNIMNLLTALAEDPDLGIAIDAIHHRPIHTMRATWAEGAFGLIYSFDAIKLGIVLEEAKDPQQRVRASWPVLAYVLADGGFLVGRFETARLETSVQPNERSAPDAFELIYATRDFAGRVGEVYLARRLPRPLSHWRLTARVWQSMATVTRLWRWLGAALGRWWVALGFGFIFERGRGSGGHRGQCFP